MPLAALALVIAAALLHALWNLAAKRASDNPQFSLLFTALIVLLWAPLGLWFAADAVPHWACASGR